MINSLPWGWLGQFANPGDPGSVVEAGAFGDGPAAGRSAYRTFTVSGPTAL